MTTTSPHYWDAFSVVSPAWAHLAVCSTASLPRLLGPEVAPPGVAIRTVRGERCLSRGEFHSEWAAAWRFPSDASTHWGQFFAEVIDMGWFHAHSYITVVTNTHYLLDDGMSDLPTLGATLARIAAWWAAPPVEERTWQTAPVPFHVIFQTEERHAAKARARLAKADIQPHDLFADAE